MRAWLPMMIVVGMTTAACQEKSKPATSEPPASPRPAVMESAPRGAPGQMSEAVFHEVLERLYLAIDKRLGEMAKIKDPAKRVAGLKELRPTSKWTAAQRKRILADLGFTQKQLTAWIVANRPIVKRHGARYAKRLAAALKGHGFTKP